MNLSFQRSGGAGRIAEEAAPRPADLWRVEDHARRGGELELPLSRAGLFWAASPSDGAARPFSGSGKHVAAIAHVRALARYGTIPNLDIFAPFMDVHACRKQLEGLPASACDGETGRAHLFSDVEIPARLQTHRYDVFHDPRGGDFTRPGYIRSRLSRHVFPITCSQHGISYSIDLYPVFVSLLSAPIYPCDAIVCLTPASREAMERRLGDIAERYCRVWDRPVPQLPRLELIPWGVDTDRFAPRDSATARRDLELPPDRPILLCVGRVRIQDKMDWTPLLLAFERVRDAVKERPLLVLAGSSYSDYGDQILAHAAQLGLREDVRAFFNLPPASLPSLYAACDVFVSPTDSVSESFGLTIIEAMACGRPVVASDWDGYKELIVHGETGFKVRTDWADCLNELDERAPLLEWEQEHLHVGQSVSVDVAQMASYLSRLLQNRELRETMGRRARDRVESLYDWRIVVRQWEALWTELGAIARSLVPKEEDRLDYVRPHYFQHFAHYASRIIDEESCVRPTARGKESLSRKSSLFLHPWARGFLRSEYLYAILDILKPAGWLGTSLPVGKLLETARKLHGLSRDCALMHLMWLAKYDLVSFDDGGGEQ